MHPKEANTTNVWQLKKCIYGLGDPSCKWYNRVKTYLLSIGLVMSKADPALFYYHDNNNLIGMIAIHVDDFLWSGTNDFETKFISKLQNTFMIGKENQSIFQYLGINLKENDSKITIDEINFAENLKLINHIHNNKDTKDILQSLKEKLLWMSRQARPDIALDICQLETNFKNSGEHDVNYPSKVITRLKHDPAQIIYKQLGKDENLKLVMYANASHGNLPDGGSQLGYLTFLVGENKKCSILNQQSKRIK